MFELTFDKYVRPPLETAKKMYFKDQKERPLLEKYIGNCALLALDENEQLFEEFIIWLRETRKEFQNKQKERSNET